MSLVEKELGEFRAALLVYRAATKTTHFHNSEHVKRALMKQIDFKGEKLSPSGDIIDPWGRPYRLIKSLDGSLLIVSLGDPEAVSSSPYVLVVQPSKEAFREGRGL